MVLHKRHGRHSTKKLESRQQGRLEPGVMEGQLRSGHRYQSDSSIIVNSSTISTMLSKKKKDKNGLKASPILSLPRELRDQIYRELLLADKVIPTNRITGNATFEPAILRVSKQLHKECSRILYHENNWFIITMNGYDLVGFYLKTQYSIVSQSIPPSNSF